MSCPSNSAAPQALIMVTPFKNHTKRSKAGVKSSFSVISALLTGIYQSLFFKNSTLPKIFLILCLSIFMKVS